MTLEDSLLQQIVERGLEIAVERGINPEDSVLLLGTGLAYMLGHSSNMLWGIEPIVDYKEILRIYVATYLDADEMAFMPKTAFLALLDELTVLAV